MRHGNELREASGAVLDSRQRAKVRNLLDWRLDVSIDHGRGRGKADLVSGDDQVNPCDNWQVRSTGQDGAYLVVENERGRTWHQVKATFLRCFKKGAR